MKKKLLYMMQYQQKVERQTLICITGENPDCNFPQMHDLPLKWASMSGVMRKTRRLGADQNPFTITK